MSNQFTSNVSQILTYSRQEAARLGNKEVAPEHLLLGIMRLGGKDINDVFAKRFAMPGEIKMEIEKRLRENPPKADATKPYYELLLNESATNILKLSVLEARVQHVEKVDVEHLFLAILHDTNDNGAKLTLESFEITYIYAFHQFKKLREREKDIEQGDDMSPAYSIPIDDEESPKSSPRGADSSSTTTRPQGQKSNSKTPVLDNFSTDMTAMARDGLLDPVVGRDKEITRILEILCRRKKNNPILIGDPGVGKSAIVEGLAQRIANRRTSPLLFNKRVVSLDMTGIVAGTKYRGQFEERMKALIRELEENRDIIIFIDEIHTMVGAGGSEGAMDAANILKPSLARGRIQCIGSTTLDEYRNKIEKDGALERRFQKVLVEPATPDETLEILHNIKERYENHHLVRYTEEALEKCVTLTHRYITDRQLPDKAIDALDEVGAHIHLATATIPPEINAQEQRLAFIIDQKNQAVRAQNFELAANYRDQQTKAEKALAAMNEKWAKEQDQTRETITADDVADVVSRMSGVPVTKMAQAEGIRIKGMADELKSAVIAQDAAIEKMVKAIQRNRVGLKEPNHPIGVFMFLGPTGVGKTYLAKKLAEFMFGSADALIRVDMSEYTEAFNVSRLIGAPPGYVGYDEGGQLTERVRRHPYSIVLLDEIEKAHGNVFNLLLQVLDEGRLTDGNGRFVNFRNTVIIMTSNAGTRQLKDFGRGVGFEAGAISLAMNDKDKEHARSIVQKALSKQFSPEFLNRLDEIITFDQLDLSAIKRIVDIELSALSKRIEALGYHLDMSEEAKEFVAKKGYDVQFGARPLKRAIQTYIEDEVSALLVDGDLSQGATLSFAPDGDKLVVTAHQ